MLLEIIAFWGFLSLILIIAAELHASLRMCGLIGCLLLAPLGLWISASGIQVQTGEITTFSGVDNTTSVSNLTGFNITNVNSTANLNQSTTITTATTFGHTETTIRQYAPVSVSYMNIEQFLALLFLGLSIFGAVHYATTLQQAH